MSKYYICEWPCEQSHRWAKPAAITKFSDDTDYGSSPHIMRRECVIQTQTTNGNLSLSLSPVRVRVHKISQRWTTRKLRVQHATSCHCGRTLIPTCWWTATFPVRLTSKVRLPIRQGIPRHRFSRPSFRWACNPMCKSKLRSEESVFPNPPLGIKFSQSPICDSLAP